MVKASLFSRFTALVLPLGALCVVPMTFASGAVHAQDEAEDDDDDILAPADDEEEASAVPRVKIGVVDFVAVGDAQKPLAEQVTVSMLSELEDASFEASAFALAANTSGEEVDEDQGQDAQAAGAKSLATAQKLLKNVSLARAEKTFRKAIASYAKAGAAMKSADAMVMAYVGLGEVYARQGQEDEANQALREAARFNPEFQLDPAVFPPQFLRAFDAERDAVLSGDKGTLIVDGTARGATVFIDGRDVGTAPIKVLGVPAGEHFVRVCQAQVGLYGALIDVAIGDEETVSPGFFKDSGVGPLDLLTQNKFSDDAAGQVADAGKAEGLTGVVVGVVNRTKTEIPTALIYVDVATKKVRHLDTLKFDGDMLNMTIESLKAREEIEKTLKNNKLSIVDDEPLLDDVVVTDQLAVPETTLRYDVEGGVAKKKRKKRSKRKRGDDDDDDDDRKMVKAGKKGKRKSLRDDKRGPLEASKSNDDPLAEDDGSLLTSPFLWGGVAGGALIVVGVAAAAGGVAAYFLVPPANANVSVIWPE